MKIRAATAYVLSVLILACSCASIVTGSHDNVDILSLPSGAAFDTNTGHNGVTPASISIPDDVTLEVTYKMEGYQDARASLAPKMSGWFWGNILLGGIIGMIIDGISGNWRTHSGSLSATLIPVTG